VKVAIVHDWLVTYAGAERALEQIVACYPNADLFAMVDFIPAGKRDFIKNKRTATSLIQKLPWAQKKYRAYLPLMPFAVEQLDITGYDLVISSSHAVAKGVLTGPAQTHICYCYSPMRYAWDLQFQYLAESGLNAGVKGWLARRQLHKLRSWDLQSSFRVDKFIAISNFIAGRIKKTYRRNSAVIYPPVDTDFFTPGHLPREDFYLTASRMVPYKKIDLIVKAFAGTPDKKLVVIGDGPAMNKIKKQAAENVTILGYQNSAALKSYMQKAKAFIFAAEEDFGIAPVEAQACGTPVIAYGKGGALETVNAVANKTGILFQEQSVESLTAALNMFEDNVEKFTAENCRANAQRFSTANFKQNLTEFVAEVVG